MAAGALVPAIRWQVLQDGIPAAGAKLYPNLSGTSTPSVLYTTAALSTPHAYPVVADADGLFPLMYFGAWSYRITVLDSTGATLIPAMDGIYDFAQVQMAASGGSALVGYIQGGTGAVATTTQARLRRDVYVDDYLPSSYVNGVTDATPYIQAAINYARSLSGGPTIFGTSAGKLFFNPNGGTYCVSSLDFTRCTGLEVVGKSVWGTNLYASKQTSSGKPVIDLTGSVGLKFSGIVVNGTDPGGNAPTIKPTVAWLLASTLSPGGDSTTNYLEDCSAVGYFSVAPLYIYGSVNGGFVRCNWEQQEDNKHAAIITAHNDAAVTSPYTSIGTGTLVTGEFSFWQSGCGTQISGSNDSHLLLYDSYCIRWNGGVIGGGGAAHVEFQGSEGRQYIFDGVEFESEAGVGGTVNAFLVTNAVVADLSLRNLDYNAAGFTGDMIGSTGSPSLPGFRVSGIPSTYLTGPLLASAADDAIFCGDPAVSLAASQTRYFGPNGFSATEALVSTPVPRACRLVSLRVSTGAIAPGAGTSIAFTVMVNGSPTTITCSVINGEVVKSDLAHQTSCAAGDLVSVKAVATAATATATGVTCSIGFIPAG